MKDDEENKKINNPTEKNNLNQNQNANLNLLNQDDLAKNKMNDITISSISYEDIDEKMNRLINLKKGDNFEFENPQKEKEESKDDTKVEETKGNKTKRNELIDKDEEEDENKKKENKIKEGFQILDKILNIEHKKIFFDYLKYKRFLLLNTNNAVTFFEKVISKLKLLNNKKDFFNILKNIKKEYDEKNVAEKKDEVDKIQKKGQNEEKKEETQKSGRKINKHTSAKKHKIKNRESLSSIKLLKNNDNNILKAQMKLKQLEFKKNRETEYIQMIEKQKERKEELIQNIETKIERQTKKIEHSLNKNKKKDTESLISSEKSISLNNISLDSRSDFENGFQILAFVFSKNISHNKLYFFECFLEKLEERRKKMKKKNSKGRRFTSMYSRKFSKKKIQENSNFFKNIKIIEPKEELSKSVTNIIEIEEDESFVDDSFIRLKEPQYKNMVDKSQLVEYDLFYKEQFFKNEVFLYDVENIEDKVEAEIKKEMNRLEIKRKLIEKKKLKEVNDLKNLDTKDLEKEIQELQKSYENCKKKEEPKVELELNNTEGFLHNGRMLGNYFKKGEEVNIPRFAMESEKEIGAREVIDFKVLRKEEVARRYFDYCCCLEERKKINKALVYARYFCRFFVDNWIFDNLSLLIIIINTILILISDPTDPNNIGNRSDNWFLYFYTIEAILKIISFRFISAEDAYIKDYWNILDFFVVIVGWISFILERAMNGTKISGLAGLRAFRILRPLKTVKRFKGLKKLVTALLASIGHLGETSIVLFFFFIIFAIAGTQMWQGIFYKRCMSVNYGYLVSTQGDTGMCTFDSNCEEYNSYGNTFICARGYRNPNYGAVNFDNTLTAFVTVFVMVTLEGWTDLFTYVSKTFKDKIYINPIIIFCYFHVFVFIAAFYLINLFLAVTNSEFEHIESSRKQLKEKPSFFKLIQGKYDHKEREKKERKEKERQLKVNNNKKSDETLRELYYKITDEAFHINKNKRNIPILYSTVKDMYIMTNKNPEDLYLQSLQIDEEETFLGKDIKRQQKEIDNLIKKKKKEIKKENNTSQEIEKENKENLNLKNIKTTKTFLEGINQPLKKKESKEKIEFEKKLKLRKNKSILPTKRASLKLDDDIVVSDSKKNVITFNNILYRVKAINSDVIEMSIDSTQEEFKVRIAEIAKSYTNNYGKKKKNIEEEEKKNQEVVKFEDLSFERKRKEKALKKKDKDYEN